MSLATRKKTLLAKIEGTYGTDPTPDGSANAILCKNLSANPIEAELVSRDLIRPYFGNSEQLMAQKFSKCDFEVEAVASGVIGKIPAYDVLLRACGFVGAATTTSFAGVVSSNVTTVTKAAHGLATGDKIIPSGCTDVNCNIAAGVAITKTSSSTFTYPSPGAADGAVAGTPVYRTAYVYTPVSSAIESATFYYNIDGVLHKLTGCRGSVELGFTVKQIPIFKFSFTGIYNPPGDVAAPSVDFSGFMIPQVVNTQNTPAFSLAGYSALLESVSLNMSNDVQYITLVGLEEVKILDRKPAGSFVLEAPTIGTKDFFSLSAAQSSAVMSLTQGSVNGYKVKIDSPSVLIGNPQYQDSNGVQMLNIPFTANPSSSGNDEVSISLM